MGGVTSAIAISSSSSSSSLAAWAGHCQLPSRSREYHCCQHVKAPSSTSTRCACCLICLLPLSRASLYRASLTLHGEMRSMPLVCSIIKAMLQIPFLFPSRPQPFFFFLSLSSVCSGFCRPALPSVMCACCRCCCCCWSKQKQMSDGNIDFLKIDF